MRKTVQQANFSTNVAALSNVVSGWLDIGKQTPNLEILRTVGAGTYALEIEWSRDGGATQFGATDTVPTVNGIPTVVVSKARWCRIRVKNDHATNAFTGHTTVVVKDAGTGR